VHFRSHCSRAIRITSHEHSEAIRLLKSLMQGTFSDKSLEESQRLLALIVESSDDAIISKNLDGIIISWNAGAERIFGYTAEEVVGRPIAILSPPSKLDEMRQILDHIKAGKRVEHYETVRRRKDGQLIDISLTVSPVCDEFGKVVAASKIARDITERKLAEQVLEKQAAQLARSNADLQQFAYVLSHDLQEPLRTITSLTESVRERCGDKFDEEATGLIDSVIGAAVRMSTLIRDLLTFSTTLNVEEVSPSPVDTEGAVQWALCNLKLGIAESSAAIDVGELPVVSGDMAGIIQVFQNLIGNSIKYRAVEPLQIRISAAPEGPAWVFAIADNGIGIAPRYHQTVFDLFKRLHGREYSGTGIGLALCKKIIEKHHGRIWVESEERHGATFKFTLPKWIPGP
jgi:PAS domain S-box-containing protein